MQTIAHIKQKRYNLIKNYPAVLWEFKNLLKKNLIINYLFNSIKKQHDF